MIIEIHSFSSDNSEKFNQAINIRFKVFTDEFSIDKDIEFDGLDYGDTVHYLVLVNNKPVATLRWRIISDGIIIERLAVLKEYRHKGIGTLLLRYVLDELKVSKRSIILYSDLSLKKFFEHNHFKVDSNAHNNENSDKLKMIYIRKYV